MKKVWIFLLSALLCLFACGCGSAAENIQSEEDVLNYLAETFGQKEYTICDTAKNEKYQLLAFAYDDGRVGHVLLKKDEKGRYNVESSNLQPSSVSTYAVQILPWEPNFVFIVNHGRAEEAIFHTLYKGKEAEERFALDKGNPAAYIAPVEWNQGDDSHLSYELRDGEGKTIDDSEL